jgi:enoyl-CoA hydratase/carnithine racemase
MTFDGLQTLLYSESDGVAEVTLNRPDRHNAFDTTMQRELAEVWRVLRTNDQVRAVVLTGAGDRAFCTGIDRSEIPDSEETYTFDPYTYEDPGHRLGPKSQGLWKPVIAAVNGMACGGAFYLLGEVEFIVAADHATFFDPHVTYGMPAVFEPIVTLGQMPFGEVMRMSLTGSNERISAQRAHQVGYVSEVVPYDELAAAAHRAAGAIASQPAPAVQATLRAIWAARELSRRQALEMGNTFLHLAMDPASLASGQDDFRRRGRIEPHVR